MKASREIGIVLELLEGGFDPWSGHALRPFQAAFCNEAFDLARVGLIFDVPVAPSNYAVQSSAFLGIELARPESGPDAYLVLFCNARFKPVRLRFGSAGCDIVAVDREC